MHFKEGQYRGQMMMVSHETMVLPDNPVRLIDLLCRKFIAQPVARRVEREGRKRQEKLSACGDAGIVGLWLF